jgi:hypothetical protein
MFTDNAQLTTSDRLSDLSYSFQPHIALSHSTTRLTYSLGAVADFIVNKNLQERNQANQTASADMSYGLTRFTTLRLSDSFTNTTGLWSGRGTGMNGSVGGDFGPVQEPNGSLLTYGRYKTNFALAELSRQFSLHGSGGVRGTVSSIWFPTDATTPVAGTLDGGQSYSAEAFYNHRFSSRQWIGTTLRAQRFDLDRNTVRTDTASLLLLYGINIQPNMSLSVFAGPELSKTTPSGELTAPPSSPSNMWSPATGAVFSWQRQKTAVMLSFVRQINNGGGLPSAVTLTTGEAELIRQLRRNLAVEIAFTATHNAPILTGPAIRTYAASTQLTYTFSNHYALYGGYGRDQSTALDSASTAFANRVWVTFSYNFSRPLGR